MGVEVWITGQLGAKRLYVINIVNTIDFPCEVILNIALYSKEFT